MSAIEGIAVLSKLSAHSSSLDDLRPKRQTDCAYAGTCEEPVGPVIPGDEDAIPLLKRQQAGYNMWRKGKRSEAYEGEDER